MQNKFIINNLGFLQEIDCDLKQAVWIDMLNPNANERADVSKALTIDLPNHADLHQIEYSNRFYDEIDDYFFCIDIVTKAAPLPESHVVSLILMKDKIITIRYADIALFNKIQSDSKHRYTQGHLELFLVLLRGVLGVAADIFELIGEKADELNLGLLGVRKRGKEQDKRLNQTLQEISYLRTLLSKGFHSLSSLGLLISFLKDSDMSKNKDFMDHLNFLQIDNSTLSVHSEHLTQKLEFQLEATLGLINIEQSKIIKVFTVLAMIFMPPTLIASIYGMNFQHMPELSSKYAYPVILVIMVLSSIIPFRYFKRKGWI